VPAELVKVLSPGYLSANSQSFLHPLLVNQRLLMAHGIQLDFVKGDRTRCAGDCKFLLIDSKTYREHWSSRPHVVLSELEQLGKTVDHILWFHTGDSAGALGSYVPELLPFVSGIYKSQIYKDKTLYKKEFYGNRLYSDFYHRNFQIEDHEPPTPDPILCDSDLEKIHTSWNIGYARCYDFKGEYLAALYKRFPANFLLNLRPSFRPVNAVRQRGVYSRMGMNFPRATIAYQRKKLAEKLGPQARVSRRQYYKEMMQSRVVVSPFGWGEINNRDFESFIFGNLLIKPTVEHLDTYPNFFQEGETYLAYQWDLSNMEEVIAKADEDYASLRGIAEEAQYRYMQETVSLEGRERFTIYLSNLLRSA